MKNIFKIMLTIALVVVAIYNVYITQQKVEKSDLVLANIEALAGYESGKN